MKPKILVLSAVLALAAGAGVYGYLHYSQQAAAVAEARNGVPARPSLVNWHPEMAQRIAAAESSVRTADDPKEGLVTLAQIYHANGFLEEAIVAYKALIRLEPTEARWCHNLAHIVAGFGQSEQAVALWAHVLALAPEYVPAHIRLGDALLKIGRNAEAEEAYASGLKYAPTDPYLNVGLARLAILRKEWMTARTRLETATGASGFRIGNDLLVTTYEQLGENARAEEVRGQAKSFGTFFDPPDPWLDAIQDEGFDAYYLTLASGSADRRDDRASAFRLLQRAIRLHPNYALAHHHLGDLYQKAGNPAEAEKSFRRAVELDPSYGDSWIQYYNLVGRTRGQAAALALLREGLQKCPDSPGLHYEYGRYLVQQKRLDEAYREFATTARLRPAEIDGLIEMAKIHFQRNEVDEGIGLLNRSLEVLPGNTFALSTLAFHYISIGAEAEARRWLGECRLQPRVDRKVLRDLGGMYQERFGRAPW